jgi:hypothetical protein
MPYEEGESWKEFLAAAVNFCNSDHIRCYTNATFSLGEEPPSSFLILYETPKQHFPPGKYARAEYPLPSMDVELPGWWRAPIKKKRFPGLTES